MRLQIQWQPYKRPAWWIRHYGQDAPRGPGYRVRAGFLTVTLWTKGY